MPVSRRRGRLPAEATISRHRSAIASNSTTNVCLPRSRYGTASPTFDSYCVFAEHHLIQWVVETTTGSSFTFYDADRRPRRRFSEDDAGPIRRNAAIHARLTDIPYSDAENGCIWQGTRSTHPQNAQNALAPITLPYTTRRAPPGASKGHWRRTKLTLHSTVTEQGSSRNAPGGGFYSRGLSLPDNIRCWSSIEAGGLSRPQK